MDRYRILALQKILLSGLSRARRMAALDVLRRKVMILAQGARKREKEQEARDYEAVLAEFTQEKIDVGERDPRLRAGTKFSSPDAGAMARLGTDR
jgi:hypothetical protein